MSYLILLNKIVNNLQDLDLSEKNDIILDKIRIVVNEQLENTNVRGSIFEILRSLLYQCLLDEVKSKEDDGKSYHIKKKLSELLIRYLETYNKIVGNITISIGPMKPMIHKDDIDKAHLLLLKKYEEIGIEKERKYKNVKAIMSSKAGVIGSDVAKLVADFSKEDIPSEFQGDIFIRFDYSGKSRKSKQKSRKSKRRSRKSKRKSQKSKRKSQKSKRRSRKSKRKSQKSKRRSR